MLLCADEGGIIRPRSLGSENDLLMLSHSHQALGLVGRIDPLPRKSHQGSGNDSTEKRGQYQMVPTGEYQLAEFWNSTTCRERLSAAFEAHWVRNGDVTKSPGLGLQISPYVSVTSVFHYLSLCAGCDSFAACVDRSYPYDSAGHRCLLPVCIHFVTTPVEYESVCLFHDNRNHPYDQYRCYLFRPLHPARHDVDVAECFLDPQSSIWRGGGEIGQISGFENALYQIGEQVVGKQCMCHVEPGDQTLPPARVTAMMVLKRAYPSLGLPLAKTSVSHRDIQSASHWSRCSATNGSSVR